MAVWFGARQIFFVDAASFVIAGILILTLPGSLMRKGTATDAKTKALSAWQDVLKGARLLFGNKLIRFALSIEFVSAIAGAQILVNTVGHIKSGLHLDSQHYGWVMAAFGIGAAIAAFISGAAFEVVLTQENDELEDNPYQGCKLIIKDDKNREFITTTPGLIRLVSQFIFDACNEKLADIEANIVFPNA
jgi:hypothetical protein